MEVQNRRCSAGHQVLGLGQDGRRCRSRSILFWWSAVTRRNWGPGQSLLCKPG